MSLMAIMRESPDIAKRLEQGTKEVRQSKANLMAAASDLNERYNEEIEEGTRKRQLLLENGKAQGMSEEDILGGYGKFLPSRQTPIMNFLFFLMRDGNRPDWLGIQKNLNESYGHIDPVVADAVSEEELDRVYGQMIHDDEKYDHVKEPKEMDTFIYGDMSHPMFVKIKKLKALSKSPNENEAFLAYRLCMKLCKKYGLDFDKVPCYYETNDK